MDPPSSRKILVKLKKGVTHAPPSVRRASIVPVEPRAVPAVVATKETIASAGLDANEAYLLSLVDGETDVDSLISLSGMSEDAAVISLEHLVRGKIVHIAPTRKRRSVNAPRRSIRPQGPSKR
jgi:hypothetical protein